METLHKGSTLITNQWGMRDNEYEKEKPPNTYRIALIGDSYAMGAGVAVEETFQFLVEERFSANTFGGEALNLEILNFSVGGYSALQQVVLCDTKIMEFQPDATFYLCASDEEARVNQRLIYPLMNNGDLIYPFLKDIAERAGVRPGMGTLEARRRLQPFGIECIRWGYDKIVKASTESGVLPVWVFLPRTDESTVEARSRVGLGRSWRRKQDLLLCRLGKRMG